MKQGFAYSFLCLLLVLFGGCKEDGSRAGSVVVDLNEVSADEARMSEFIDSISYLALETADECVLGEVSDMAVADSFYVMLDGKSNAVFTFDKAGRFLTQIGVHGPGPNEYGEASQIDVVPSTNEILIYDRFGQKVLFFSPDGKCGRVILAIGFAYDFAYVESDACRGFLFVDNRTLQAGRSGILWQNPGIGEFRQLLPRRTEYQSNNPHDIFCANGNVMVAAPPFDNDVYVVKGDSIETVLALDVLPSPSDYDIENGTDRDMQSFRRLSFVVTSRWVFMDFWSGANGNRQLVLDRKSGRHQVVKALKEDIGEHPLLDLYPVCIDDVQIALAAPDNPDDNPLLAFIHYKK